MRGRPGRRARYVLTRLVAIPVLLHVCACGGKTPAPTPTPVASSWSVRQNGTVVEIAFGKGTDHPQYAALHTESGYFRMNTGPGSGWGTSIVVLPAFWSGGIYYQGGRTSATWSTAGDALLISFSATVSALVVQGQIRLEPPTATSLTATVTVTVDGAVAIDRRPGEAFKPVFLSSMHILPNVWDAQVFPIPDEGWIAQPPVQASAFGLTGGTSSWKIRAPTVDVLLDQGLQVTGWVTRTADANADNVGFWAASDDVLRRWQYRLRASAP